VNGRVEAQNSLAMMHWGIYAMSSEFTMSSRYLHAKSSRRCCSDRMYSQSRGVVRSRSFADCDQGTRMLGRLWHHQSNMRCECSVRVPNKVFADRFPMVVGCQSSASMHLALSSGATVSNDQSRHIESDRDMLITVRRAQNIGTKSGFR
jgi:hypothetical protein